MVLIGITGGIACGKTLVARLFEAHGVPVIFADSLARSVLDSCSDVLVEIVACFGERVLDTNGSIDRRVLGQTVFADASGRRKLELLTHPHILRLAQIEATKLQERGHMLAAFEAALLVECGLADAFRPLVVVTVDPATQLRRLQERDGLSESQAIERIATQASAREKTAVADHVIDTGVSIDEVALLVRSTLRSICVDTGISVERFPLLRCVDVRA